MDIKVMNENKEMEALNILETNAVECQPILLDEINIKDNKKCIDEIRSALTELAEIKKRAEEQQDKYKYAYTEGINNDSVAKIIDYIIKGETK